MYFSTQLENVYNAHENLMQGCENARMRGKFRARLRGTFAKTKVPPAKVFGWVQLKARLEIAPLSIVTVMPHKIIKNYDAAMWVVQK